MKSFCCSGGGSSSSSSGRERLAIQHYFQQQ
jgi:hypothetical protein